MHSGIKKYINNKYIPYTVLFMILLALHLPMQLNISDDWGFGTYLQNMSLWKLIERIYISGSGKVLPDGAGAVFTFLPWWIWKVVDSAIRTGMAVCIVYVFTDRSAHARWIGALAVLLYPNSLLLSAGYCVTSTNYMWPAAAVLVSLCILKTVTLGEKVKPWMEVAAIVCCLYGANQEQGAAILIASHVAFIAFLFFVNVKDSGKKQARDAGVVSLRKKTASYVNPLSRSMGVVYFNLALALIVLVLFVTSPGFRLKSVPECNTVALPYFTVMSVWDKVSLGFTTTCAHFMSGFNAVWMILLLLLAVAGAFSGAAGLRVLPAVPFFMQLCIFALRGRFGKYFDNVTEWSHDMTDFLQVDTSNFNDWRAYVPMVVAILMVAFVLIGIYCIYGRSPKTLLMLVTFMAGLCSRMTMGFSYTVFGSGSRTFTYMYFCLIVLIVMLAADVVKPYVAGTVEKEVCAVNPEDVIAGESEGQALAGRVSFLLVLAGVVASLAFAGLVLAVMYGSNVVIKPYNLSENVVIAADGVIKGEGTGGTESEEADGLGEDVSSKQSQKYEGVDVNSHIRYSVDVKDDGTYTSMSGWCIQEGQDVGFFDAQVLLFDESGNFYTVKTDYRQVYNLTLMMDDGNDYENGGFTARIKNSEVSKIFGDNAGYGIALLYHGNYLVVCKNS